MRMIYDFSDPELKHDSNKEKKNKEPIEFIKVDNNQNSPIKTENNNIADTQDVQEKLKTIFNQATEVNEENNIKKPKTLKIKSIGLKKDDKCNEFDTANTLSLQELSNKNESISHISQFDFIEKEEEIESSSSLEDIEKIESYKNIVASPIDEIDNCKYKDRGDEFLNNFINNKTEHHTKSKSAISSTPRYFELVAKPFEYFTKWIVSMLITVATLGAYMPWGRVVTRDYLAFHSLLNGSFFEYKNRVKKYLPMHLLITFIILGLFFSLYFKSTKALFVFSVFLLSFSPLFFYKLREFDIEAFSYRDIRLKFDNIKVVEFYKLYLSVIASFLIPLTTVLWFIKEYKLKINQIEFIGLLELFIAIFSLILWLVVSKVYQAYIKHQINNLSFGSSEIFFENNENIYKVFSYISFFIFIVLSSILILWYGLNEYLVSVNSTVKFIIFYFVTITLLGFLKGIIDIVLHNYIFNNIKVKGNYFQSSVSTIKYSITSGLNWLVSSFTLFILYPFFQIILLRIKLKDTEFICDECNELIEKSV